ncbi:response regulator transcription factor [Cryptosporangium minutisporangium]|uniref:Response regulatory domain-containing protein n=1 Tax=Cryptosporangium minutisporangium TaxID=113569 RepID=A0ABP6T3T8_9ACTN
MGAIVIAEDDPDIRGMISEKLSRAGHSVTATEDGAAALVAVRRSVPDVVVLDMQMPGLSGLDVVRLLRVDPATADVPVIMVTSHSQAQYIGESFNSGVNDFLAKPFSPRELAARIERLMVDGQEPDDGGSTQVATAAEAVVDALVATEEAEEKVGRRRFFRLLTPSS